MPQQVLGHAARTILVILFVLILPWLLIFGIAALGMYLQKRRAADVSSPRQIPQWKPPKAA